MSTRLLVALAFFTAIVTSAVFLLLVGLGPEATCSEYGYTPVVLEEGSGVVCIPWEDVLEP